VSPDTKRGFAHARARLASPASLLGQLASVSAGLYFQSRPTRVLFVANVEAERRFSSPERESSPVAAMRSLSRAVRRHPQREFPHDCSEADEQSHFFYLLILIRGCLERSSLFSGFSLAAGWFFLTSRAPFDHSRLTVLINRASCTMPGCAAFRFFVPLSPFQGISNKCIAPRASLGDVIGRHRTPSSFIPREEMFARSRRFVRFDALRPSAAVARPCFSSSPRFRACFRCIPD